VTIPSLFIVTPVHNRRSVTTEFARTLSRQSLPQVVLVLVDDGSTDGTAEAVKEILPSTVVLRGNGNLWWAGGLQKGLNWLAAQTLPDHAMVAFMNDDVSFENNFLDRATKELKELATGCFLTVSGVFYPSGHRSNEAVVCDWAGYRYRDYGKHPEKIDCTTTRSLFMRWGDLRRVGGFHSTTLPHYLSDYEFTIRAHRRGIKLIPATTVLAQFDDVATGLHNTKGLRLGSKLRRLFSPRFSANPLYQFVYVWYACPFVWKIPSWCQIVFSTLRFLK